PDAIDTSPPSAQAQVASGEIAEKRDPQVRDDGLEIRHQIADRGVPGHPRLLALPVSPQTAAPVPGRGVVQAAPESPPVARTAALDQPHLGTCSPEALQIFRC
ncbi:MAG: hypothetical protein ACRDP6_26760, partial [Actinoallomurus sp.]